MMNSEKQVRAFRGATQLAEDTPAQMASAVTELLGEIMSQNGLEDGDLISVLFTATQDLVSDFPATGARSMGFGDVPLMCAAEIAVVGSLPRCVRVMLHARTTRERGDVKHIYLRGASVLRKDLQK
jgi:chorismate mutase